MLSLDLQEAAARYALQSLPRLRSVKSIALCAGSPGAPGPVDPALVKRLRDPRVNSMGLARSDLYLPERDAVVGILIPKVIAPGMERVIVTMWCFAVPTVRSEDTYCRVSVEFRCRDGVWRASAPYRPWSTDFEQLLYRDTAAPACRIPDYYVTLAWTHDSELLAFDTFSASIFRSSLTLGTCRKAGAIALPPGADLTYWDNLNCISPSGKRLTSAVGVPSTLVAETGSRVFVDLATNAQLTVPFVRPAADRARVCWLDDDHWMQFVASPGQPHFDVYSVPDKRIVTQVPIDGAPLRGRIDVPSGVTDVRVFAFDYDNPATQTIRLPAGFPFSNLPAVAGPSHTFRSLAPRDFDFLYSRAAARRRRRLLVFRRERRLPYLVEYLVLVVDEENLTPLASFQISEVPGCQKRLRCSCTSRRTVVASASR